MASHMKIRLYGTVNDSIVDGPGLRYTVFAQGCLHACPGCHNPKSQDLQGGYLEDIDHILKDIDANPLLDGVTFSGGEPFLQCEAFFKLAHEVKKRQLHIIIYSGYMFEEILQMDQKANDLLALCDTLIDGRFVSSLRSLNLLYRGSSNQRIIDIQASLKNNKVVEQVISDYGEFIY